MKVPFFLLFLLSVKVYSAIYQGTASDDVIQGGNESDQIFLGDGADVGNGMTGNDIVFGEPGPDILQGGEGNDTMIGGSVNSIADNAANDFTGGPGNDLLMGGIYGDTYHYGQGDGFDCIREPGTMPGEVDKVVFDPGITRSSLEFSREKGDLFIAITGGDILRIESWFGMSDGGSRIEEFRFDSDLTLYGADLAFDGVAWNGSAGADNYTAPGGGNFWIHGGAGNDVLVGAGGMDVILGGAGGDSLSGRDGDDGLYGEADNDTLHGENGNDTLDGGGGADTLNGNAGDDILEGGTGNDALNGANGNDVYRWNLGDGDDSITDDCYSTGLGAVNRLVFGPGIPPSDVTPEVVSVGSQHLKFVIRQNGVVVGSAQVNNWTYSTSGVQHKDAWRIEFADGTVWNGTYLGTALADTLNGTSGADELHGATGGDVLSGNDGNDLLYGEADNDTLHGGNGNDTLYGGVGADTLNGNAGDDILEGGTGNDILDGGSGNDVFRWNLGDGDDLITDYYYATDLGVVNRLVFGPGILPSDVTPEMVAIGSQHLKFVVRQNGVVAGSAQVNYWTYSHVGVQHKDAWRIEFADETVWNGTYLGTALADTLNGTSGADELHGATGGDVLSGNDGNDLLYGEADNDTLHGGNGNDTLYGGVGADTLNGNAGDDILEGGTGNDTLNGANGSDVYRWNLGDGDDSITDYYYATDLGAVNRLVFGPGILPSDVTPEMVVVGSQHLKFVVRQNGVAMGSALVNNWTYSTSGVQHKDAWRIEFADGTVWNGTYLGTALADTLNGTSGADELHGAAGSDVLSGNDGNDLLYGEADNDTLHGGNGIDTLYGGVGADTLNGNTGDDILEGGTGNDTLNGANGNDVYRWNLGDGDDSITDDYNSTGLGAINRLVFGPGILPTDVTSEVVSVGSQHLKFVVRQNGVAAGSAQVNFWTSYTSGVQHKDAWRIEFADGTIWNGTYLGTALADTLNGTSGADELHGAAGTDVLSGNDGNDLLYGEADNDTLNGNAGDDILEGGTGNDTLNGANGNDVYRWNPGDGDDSITDDCYSTGLGAVNRLVFGPGILPGDVISQVVPGNANHIKFVIYQNGVVSGSVLINNWAYVYNAARHADTWRLDFANGTTWDGRTMATALADVLTGTALADVLNGGAGNDTLYGGGGDDTLDGGEGNDGLYGEAGNDILRGASGSDYLYGGAGNDTYIWSPGDGNPVITDDYIETTAINTLILNGIADYSQLSFVRTGTYDLEIRIENEFGGESKITIMNWCRQQAGVYHFAGWKLQVDGLGIHGFSGVPTTGNDVLAGSDSGVILFGMNGNDSLTGGTGDDWIMGDGGNDSLLGGLGDDILNSGVGNDSMNGGLGTDLYLFENGDGDDTVAEVVSLSGSPDDQNMMVFGSGVLPNDIAIARSGDNLRIDYGNPISSVTVLNWFQGTYDLPLISEIRFKDGSVWNDSFMNSRVGLGSVNSQDSAQNAPSIMDAEELEGQLDEAAAVTPTALVLLTPLQ